MKYVDYERAFSEARLNKYLEACKGNKAKALTLYRHNVKLCQKFYGMLNIFEIILRNAINIHYQVYFNDKDWIIHQAEEGGMLAKIPQKSELDRTIEGLKAAHCYNNDRIVSSLTFGFWTHLFTKLPFRCGGNSLLQIFPNRFKGLGQRAIFNELMVIKSFRNRIAHHEAICFDKLGGIDVHGASEHYTLVLKYIFFLGYPCNHLFFGIDIMPDKILRKIEELR